MVSPTRWWSGDLPSVQPCLCPMTAVIDPSKSPQALTHEKVGKDGAWRDDCLSKRWSISLRFALDLLFIFIPIQGQTSVWEHTDWVARKKPHDGKLQSTWYNKAPLSVLWDWIWSHPSNQRAHALALVKLPLSLVGEEELQHLHPKKYNFITFVTFIFFCRGLLTEYTNDACQCRCKVGVTGWAGGGFSRVRVF